MKRFAVIILLLLCIQCAYAKKTIKVSDENKGYAGKLPNIEQAFSSKSEKKEFETGKIDPKDLIKAPTEDKLFVDVIIKKEKTSQYVNDIRRVIPVLEKLKTCLENDENIQKYNANVNMLDLYAKDIEKEYKNKPQGHSYSYESLMYIVNYAKIVANLRFESSAYSRYMSYSGDGAQYSPQNIASQTKILLEQINDVLQVLKNER